MSDDSENNPVQEYYQNMIAGYHVMLYKRWIRPAKCYTEEQKSQLLHLLRSIEDGKPDDTKRLLAGLDPNLQLSFQGGKESLLEFAARQARHPDCVRAVIAAGADIKAPRLILNAINGPNFPLLAELLQAGAELNLAPTDGEVLFDGCRRGPSHLEMLQKAGVSLEMTGTFYQNNKKEITQVTALMFAIALGEVNSVKFLLKAGAKVDARDSRGQTATDWVKTLRSKAKAEKITQLLIDSGATDSGKKSESEATVDFAERSKSEEFKKAIELVKGFTRAAAKPVELSEGKLPGAKSFNLRKVKPMFEFLSEVRNAVVPLNAMAFFSENTYGDGPEEPVLVLLPTTDYREAIVAFETPEGQSIDSHELNKWLTELERAQPFFITHIKPDTVRAVFTTPLAEQEKIAKAIQQICPEVTKITPEFVKKLEQSRELFLWWD
jgi:hypothetical protein